MSCKCAALLSTKHSSSVDKPHPSGHFRRVIGQRALTEFNVLGWKQTLQIGERLWVISCYTLQWRHNGRDDVSNHQPHDCLLNRLYRRGSKKISKLSVTGLCAENSPVIVEFPGQMANNADNVSIWWRHHDWRIVNQVISYLLVVNNIMRHYMFPHACVRIVILMLLPKIAVPLIQWFMSRFIDKDHLMQHS